MQLSAWHGSLVSKFLLRKSETISRTMNCCQWNRSNLGIKPESRTRRLAKGELAIMSGAERDILSRETAARMLMVQRGVRLVEVPGVGHAPSLVEPAALEALTDFLAAKG
jgi:pimeloyl-ACP methyl ester carboxylesterase